MSLDPGTRIGPYEVVGPLGAGGMGEVYKARDTNLDRDVALKILPEAFAEDAERLERFEREAKALAALNHPNIAQVYGLEGSEFRQASRGSDPLDNAASAPRPLRAIAMEFVEGATLEDAIGDAGIPVADALPIARQIADALEAAHERGVIHRDLKPANVMLTADGQVKVLDFGLAKAMDSSPVSGSVSDSPTLTARATQMGTIIGTAAYMSPEQARGKSVDRRADVWAFGAVLYEMLTAQRAFAGAEITDVLAKVIERDADFDRLPTETPRAIRQLLARCLTKDPKRRLRDIGEACVTIEDVITGRAHEPATPADLTRSSGRGTTLLPWAIAGALALLIVFLLARPTAPDGVSQSVHASLNLPPDVEFFAKPAISGNGLVAAFVGVSEGRRRIYVRRLDSPDTTALTGSDAANLGAFSPEGEDIAIVTTTGLLSRLSIDGSISQQLAEADFTASTTWGADGRIVFGKEGRLWAIAPDGGTPEVVTTLDDAAGEIAHRFPVVSADGAWVFFNSYSGSSDEDVRLNVVDLRAGTRSVLLQDRSQAVWASADQVVLARDAGLYTVGFRDGQLVGTPVRVYDDLAFSVTGGWGVAVSDTGTLLTAGADVSRARLVWVSMDGVETPINSGVRAYSNPRVSPDGRHVAFSQEDGIWTLDIARSAFTRVAPAGSRYAVWIDASRLAFRREVDLATSRADGTTAPESIAGTAFNDYAASASPDGKTLAVVRINPTTSGDVYLISVDGTDPPRAFVDSPAYEGGAQFSPNGQWIAYTSDEGGQPEVYLAPYPTANQRFAVSSSGGLHPTWSHDGRSIFYRSGQRMMAVDATFGADNTVAPRFTPERVLFEQQYKFGPNLSIPHYSLSADGQRFLMVKEEPGARSLSLITNWLRPPGR